MTMTTVVDRLLSRRSNGVDVLREADALDAEHLQRVLSAAADLAASDTEAASRLVDVVEDAAHPAGAPDVVPAANYLRARLLVQAGRPEPALHRIAAARDAYSELGDHLAALRTDLGRMHVLDDLGRHDEAADVGQALLADLDRCGSTDDVARLRAAALGNVGVCLGFTGRNEEAIEAYRRAESAWRRLGRDHEATAALANQGIELLAVGNAAAALACLDRATTAFESADDPAWLGKCLGHRGAARAASGRYVDALADYERARDLLESLGARTESWRLSIETAATLNALGLYDEASSLVHEPTAHLRQAGLHHDLAAALAISGRAHLAAGRLDQAREALAEAAELCAAVNDRLGRASALLDLSRTVGADEALTYARQATELLEGRSWPGPRCLSLVRLAELTDDPVLAGTGLAEARALADELGVPHLQLAVNQTEGARLRRGGPVDAAVQVLDGALAQVEQLGTGLRDETLRAAFLRSAGATRAELIGALLDRGRPEDVDRAALLADEAKGRTLVEVLQGALRPHSEAVDDPVSLSLASQLNSAYSALFSADEGRRGALRARAEGLERQLAVRGALAAPSDVAVRSAAAGLVSPSTAAIAYHVVDEQVMAFVPQADGRYAVRRVTDVPRLAGLLDDLDAHLGRHAVGVIARYGQARAAACRRILQELYLRIVAPVRGLLPAAGSAPRTLLVVPHGLLHRVPFHALHDGRQYLLADWVITIAPSLAAAGLASVRARPRPDVAVVGVADPTTPLIEDEARSVAEIATGATVVLGAEATLDRVREATSRAGLVHLACHGLFRFNNPTFSSLRLADRWVRAAELAGAVADGAVLVLSACETARVNTDGDEAAGLARSFLAAGARNVVVSQWVADDACTAALMGRLHRGLAAGRSPSSALRGAQLATLIDHPHPFHWAPFIAVGAPGSTEEH